MIGTCRKESTAPSLELPLYTSTALASSDILHGRFGRVVSGDHAVEKVLHLVGTNERIAVVLQLGKIGAPLEVDGSTIAVEDPPFSIFSVLSVDLEEWRTMSKVCGIFEERDAENDADSSNAHRARVRLLGIVRTKNTRNLRDHRYVGADVARWEEEVEHLQRGAIQVSEKDFASRSDDEIFRLDIPVDPFDFVQCIDAFTSLLEDFILGGTESVASHGYMPRDSSHPLGRAPVPKITHVKAMEHLCDEVRLANVSLRFF